VAEVGLRRRGRGAGANEGLLSGLQRRQVEIADAMTARFSDDTRRCRNPRLLARRLSMISVNPMGMRFGISESASRKSFSGPRRDTRRIAGALIREDDAALLVESVDFIDRPPA